MVSKVLIVIGIMFLCGCSRVSQVDNCLVVAREGGSDVVFQRKNLYILAHDGLWRRSKPAISVHIYDNPLQTGKRYRFGCDFKIVAPRHAGDYVIDGIVEMLEGERCNLELKYNVDTEDMSGMYRVVETCDDL